MGWHAEAHALALRGVTDLERAELVRDGRVVAVVVGSGAEAACFGWDGEKLARLRMPQLTAAGALRGLERRYPGGRWLRFGPGGSALAA